MAASKGTTNKKKTSSSSGNTRKSTTRTSNKNTKAYQKQREMERAEAATPPENLREIYAIICIAFNLILILGTYGVCGKAGKVVSGFFFGLVGATYFVLPVAFSIGFIFFMANGPKPKLIKKFIWFFILFMVIGFICQLAVYSKDATIKDLYFDGYNDHRGGGIIFGGLAVLITKLISKAGTIIVTIVLAIIAIIEITNVRIVDLFRKLVIEFPDIRESYDGYDDDDDEYDEYGDEYSDEINVRKVRDKDILRNIRVLDKQNKPGTATKKKSGKTPKANKIVPEEEIHEILPEEDIRSKGTGTSKRYLPETESEIRMPGDMGYASDYRVEKDSQELLEEINSSNAFYQTGKTNKPANDSGSHSNKSGNKKKKDAGELYELHVDPKTYEDPLGIQDGYEKGLQEGYGMDMGQGSDQGYDQGNDQSYDQGNDQSYDQGYDQSYEQDNSTSFNPTNEEIYKGPSRKNSESNSNDNTGKTQKSSVRSSSEAHSEEDEKVTRQDKENATKEIGNEISNQEEKKKYVFPPMKLLKSGGRSAFDRSGDTTVRETAIKLKDALESFGVRVTITNCSVGPSITRYELQPEQGVRVNKILSLESDIKMALAATDIRIEAPIPGKAAVGIEIPNKKNQVVYFRDLIDNDIFDRFKSNLAFAVGKDISGQIIISDIAKMPHLLIAGATGSGKSVCINTLIMSILYKSSPEDVRMIMVDPKMVELTAYNGIPHLLIPVVTDPKKAAGALNWAVEEMTKRYQLFSNYNVRNIEGFNKKVKEIGPTDDALFKHMPQLLVIVDELADLMMVAHKEVEDSIVRLSQLARAAGIHLVIATQRPSVDVITGLIKANVPSRIAFSVSSGVDSRTIIDMVGAEKLLGKGDMLFYPTGYTKPVRVQGAFIDDDEVVSVVEFIKEHYGETSYDSSVTQTIETSSVGSPSTDPGGSEEDGKYDEYFEDAARFVIEKDKASIGYLQRMLRIGFNRAARIMDQLEDFGVVGPEEGTKPRRINMTISEFEAKLQG